MDGGYSWVICAVAFCGYFFMVMGLGAFGVMYEELLDHFSATNAETSMIISLNNAFGAFAGLFMDPIIRRYGCRLIGIVGSVLGAVAYGGCFFAQSILHLCIGYGILGGMANGMLIFSGTVILHQYFDQRRSLATAIASCGVSVSCLVMPPIVRWFIDVHGWRAAMLGIGALYLHNAIGSTLMRPSKHHDNNQSKKTIDSDEGKESTATCWKTFFRFIVMLIMSVVRNFDLTLIRDPRLFIFIFGTSVNIFGYLIPLIYIPVYSVSNFGFSQAQAAVLPSAISGAMLAGRITSGILGDRCTFLQSPRHRICQYTIPSIVCGLVSAATYLMDTQEAVIIYCCIFGFFTGSYIVVQQPVLVDMFGVDNLSKVFSMHLLIGGITSFFCQPFAGWLADISGSFGLAFVAAGLIQVLSAVLLLVLVPLTPARAKQIENQCAIEAEIITTKSDDGKLQNYKTDINDAELCNNNRPVNGVTA